MPKTGKRGFTFDEFCLVVKYGEKADLIDGVIHMASPENLDAYRLSVWLVRLMGDLAELKDAGEIFYSRVAFRLSPSSAPEPDIAFVAKDRADSLQWGHVEGAPDLAMEIVCPESVERDYEKKRANYQEAGVREYWIVDEIQETVTLLRLNARGKFREVRPKKGVLKSEVLPGFWLRLEWLWQQPRPKKVDILNIILTEQP